MDKISLLGRYHLPTEVEKYKTMNVLEKEQYLKTLCPPVAQAILKRFNEEAELERKVKTIVMKR